MTGRFDDQEHPIQMTLEIIGGKWKPIILYSLANGKKRFGELQRAVPKASRQVLTQHLRELERHGIVHREVYQQIPPKVEYSLTNMGQTLMPVIYVMDEWGAHYVEFTVEELAIELEF